MFKLKHLLLLPYFLLVSMLTLAQNKENWQIHHLEDLQLNHSEIYLNKPTISGAMYQMNKSSIIKASNHDRMLFIVDGTCSAIVNSKSFELKTGDVIFLKSSDSITFSTSIKVMLWTSKSTKTNHKSQTKKFSKEEIESHRNSSENIWNSFIETSTMVAGLYMLPKSLDGDNTLNHSFDEINYVVNGSAKFKMNDTIIDVKPGSIMWVKRGVDHYFYDLSDDFDVYILFETINMNHDH